MLNKSTRIAFRIRVLYFIQLPESFGRKLLHCNHCNFQALQPVFFDFQNAICNSSQYSVLFCFLQTPCKGFYKYNAIIKLIEALFHRRTCHSLGQVEVSSVPALPLSFASALPAPRKWQQSQRFRQMGG